MKDTSAQNRKRLQRIGEVLRNPREQKDELRALQDAILRNRRKVETTHHQFYL